MSIFIETLINRYKSIGVASYDAGGANLLNSLVKKFTQINFLLYVDGPALNIFDAENSTKIEDESLFLEKVDFLLLGTGTTNFEKKILSKAISNNILTASFLDHFVNFKERFLLNSSNVYPDYCFVSDENALKIAKDELYPYDQIYLCENYYIESIKDVLINTDAESDTVLYILENIKEDWGDLLPWEIAFNNFYNNFFIKKNYYRNIIVRPHPKDDISIYSSLSKYNEIIFDTKPSGIDSLTKVNTVVGVESYFLYLAKNLGFTVYSSLPNEIRAPRLPKDTYRIIDA